jgi:hypothetical protein
MAIDIVAAWKLRICTERLLLRTAMLDVMRATSALLRWATPKIIKLNFSFCDFRNFKKSGNVLN